MEFLGLLIDTLLMIVWILADKQKDILKHITTVLKAQQHPPSSLQSLAGKLNFIAKAFPLGKPFIRRLCDLAVGKHPKWIVQIDEILKQDLLLWEEF